MINILIGTPQEALDIALLPITLIDLKVIYLILEVDYALLKLLDLGFIL